MSKFTISRKSHRVFVDEETVSVTIDVDISCDGGIGPHDFTHNRVTGEAIVDIGDAPGVEISVATQKALDIANTRAEQALRSYLGYEEAALAAAKAPRLPANRGEAA